MHFNRVLPALSTGVATGSAAAVPSNDKLSLQPTVARLTLYNAPSQMVHPQEHNSSGDHVSPPLPTLTSDTQCLGKVKPTKVWNGSGRRYACVTSSYCSTFEFPTLSSTPNIDPQSCPETSTTMEVCIGSGGKWACSTDTVCANYPIPTKPSPYPDGCTKTGESCVGVISNTNECPAKLAARTQNMPATQGSQPTALPAWFLPGRVPIPVPVPKESSVLATDLASIETALPFSSLSQFNSTLRGRDDDDPFDCYSCKCEALEKPECLDITLKSFHEFHRIYLLEVTENGKKVCKEMKHECEDCSGTEGTPMDCGDGNNLEFNGNVVKFHSKKQDRDFVYILPTEKNKDVICFPNFNCNAKYFHLRIGCGDD